MKTSKLKSETPTKLETSGRYVVVVDRGWIFAGDLSEADGMITLTRVVWVKQWESIWFSGVLRNPKDKNVTIEVMDHNVEIPVGTVIFRVPVNAEWGL